ncbi:MAG TPA: hypothetical protein VGS22_17585 [Thermoanaerobaculia bacterium]|jgi:hypothetical protein|nr:hypothetical protein [Thermoanaerobaculia bacterium]
MKPLAKSFSALAVLALSALSPRSATAQTITVVDMIPKFMSNEQANQSEPNLAIDPATPSRMAASAFITNPTKPNKASIFLSTNGGQSWTLQPILSGSATLCNTSFCDVTLRFAGTSGKLYVSSLMAVPDGATDFIMNYEVNRFDDVFANPTPVQVEKRSGVVPDVPDQPYIQATTVLGGEGTNLDRLFVGVNDARLSVAPQTATVDVNLNAGAASPAAMLVQPVEETMPPDPPGQDGSAVRAAFHSSGVVYAAFYSPLSETKANIVVVRDDQWGASAQPFSVLSTGGVAGTIVVASTAYSGDGTAKLNKQRVGRSQISIAVDPNDSQSVWLVWGDAAGNANITLHLRHSADGGKTWGDADLRTISAATNPAVAVNSLGQVGFLYQAVDASGNWRTKVEISGDDFVSMPATFILSIADSTEVGIGANFIGDYLHLMAVGKDFFGVFSAHNDPHPVNFPDVDNLIFLRENDGDNMLSNGSFVQPSVDPFFFHIEMVTPDNDFFVRDWTEAGSHDPGLEPSSHSVFYELSDVWNRPDNVSGSPATTKAPPHVDPQPGTNFAFVRVGRKAQASAGAPNVDVTPNFYYADFGAGLKYKDAGVAAPLPLTFAPNQKELTLPDGQGYEWNLPAEHSSHVCMGVEIDSTPDPFADPTLKNHVPGWPTLDTAVLYDNNKAQRNIIYPEMKIKSKAHYYALVRNAASVSRSVCLRLDSPVAVTTRFASIQIDACGIVTTPYRPASTVCLPGMAAGEVRALKVTVDVPQSALGADLPLAFTEVTVSGPSGKPRDGFAISPVGTTTDAAAHANLVFQAAVFGRLAALYNDPAAQFWTAKTRDLLTSGFSLSQYVSFLQQVRPYLSRLTGLVPRSTSPCAPSPYGDLDLLLGAIQGGDPELIAPAHNDYLQALDIAITLSQIAVNGPGA